MSGKGPESTAERFRRLEPLLDRALELEGDEQERFLKTCGEVYPDLIADLRRALSLDESSLPGLGELAADAVRERSTDRRNLRAGPWQLVEKLGRGGMGTVYRAIRADGAFDKEVAIKLLRGQDLRFKDHLERERQLLARLEHPAIARLIDGGLLGDGQPYLVMELAEGRNLDVWCREEKPSLARRLNVFIAICGAVADAHSHLIVHRDLKPSNIRVADDDSVKLLDFGIAKLLDPEAKRGETRSVALTPEYAAPEQLDGGVITTRTDVYALGALLHLLLTGRSPHPHFDGNWAAMIEAVCQRDVPPPSRVSEADESGLSASELRGDLDAICLRALSRDPTRRYASAENLAADVQRHLDGRPVQARPRSMGYSLSRWFRRNWLPASLGISAFILLAGAAGLLAWQGRRIALERDQALLEARRSEAVRNYLLLMFRRASDASDDASKLSARELLDQSAGQVETVFAGDPAARQSVLAALGEIYILLSDFEGAAPLLHRFVELEDGSSPRDQRARVLIDLGTADLRLGDPAAACRDADSAMALLDESVSVEKILVGEAELVRGQCLRLAGDAKGSLAAYRRGAELHLAALGDGDRRSATAMSNLALGEMYAGQYVDARRDFSRALEIFQRAGQGESDHVASVLNNIAALSMFLGHPRQAEEDFSRAIALRVKLGGDQSAAMGALLSNQARVKALLGHPDEAGKLAQQAEDMTRRFTSEDSIDTAAVRLAGADIALMVGDLDRAASRIMAARKALEARLGPSHPIAARAGLAAAELADRRGQAKLSEQEYRQSIDLLAGAGATAQRYLASGRCAYAAFLLRRKRSAEAAQQAAQCLQSRTALAPDDSWEVAEARLLQSVARGELDPARRALKTIRDHLGETSPMVHQLGALLPDAAK